MPIHFNTLQPGNELPPVTLETISRTTLALYAGASGDHNPMHIDSDFARAAGFDDVFAHGMLAMAHLGRALCQWSPQAAIREYKVRFQKITNLQDTLTCRAVVTERFQFDGEDRLRLDLTASNQHHEVKIAGSAVMALTHIKSSEVR